MRWARAAALGMRKNGVNLGGRGLAYPMRQPFEAMAEHRAGSFQESRIAECGEHFGLQRCLIPQGMGDLD